MQETPSGQGVSHITIDEAEAGQRIDNFLAKRLPGLPRSYIYRIIRTGQVRVNSSRIKPTRKLVAGDTIRVPPVRDAQGKQFTVPDSFINTVESSVIYEDERVLAVNKPAGLAVHAGSGLSFGVIEALRQSRDDRRYELVHRIDRYTSGCLLIGKTLAATRLFQDHFRQRTVEKKYIAIVAGNWIVTNETVTNRLSSNVEISGERMVVEDDRGKTAISHFTTLTAFAAASEVGVVIETGRTHQIRVHCCGLGHPIIGDNKYGDKPSNRRFKQLGLSRMFLHAEHLSIDGELQLSCSVDAEWQSARQILAGTKPHA